LGVISRSQTDVQPVFDAIVASAVRLLGAYSGVLTRIAGDQIVLAALTSSDDAGDAATRALFPQALKDELSKAGQWDKMAAGYALAIHQRGPVNVADAHTDPRWPEAARAYARLRGYRSWVAVPMLRHDGAIGTISVTRRAPGGFTDDEIALLQTFADQAVIAIENVRLFTELEGRNHDLSEALNRQTATSEILRVISQSPTELQPVLDALVKSAVRFCAANDAVIHRLVGEELPFVAHHGPIRVLAAHVARLNGTTVGRCVLERRVVHVADLQAETQEFPDGSAIARELDYRTILSVPLLREGVPLGAIALRRSAVEPFSEKHIELLKIFADQAVIAIENVRLFTELQEKNRALTDAHAQVTEALDQQTATAEILRVISSSPTDVQPVFEAIVQSAVGLCKGFFGAVFRYEDVVSLVATCNVPQERLKALRRIYPGPPAADTAPGRALLTRAVVHIHDQASNEEFSGTVARASGYRTNIAVPMLRNGQPIGAIAVARSEVQPFSETEIQLLKTFADQAVIAIENARLFNELQARTTELIRSVDELTALGDVGRALSSTLDLEAVLQTIVTRATQLTGTAGCVMWEYDQRSEEFRLRASHYAEGTDSAILPARGGVTTIPRGQG